MGLRKPTKPILFGGSSKTQCFPGGRTRDRPRQTGQGPTGSGRVVGRTGVCGDGVRRPTDREVGPRTERSRGTSYRWSVLSSGRHKVRVRKLERAPTLVGERSVGRGNNLKEGRGSGRRRKHSIQPEHKDRNLLSRRYLYRRTSVLDGDSTEVRSDPGRHVYDPYPPAVLVRYRIGIWVRVCRPGTPRVTPLFSLRHRCRPVVNRRTETDESCTNDLLGTTDNTECVNW